MGEKDRLKCVVEWNEMATPTDSRRRCMGGK
jgi:hypothetical protein